MKLGYIHIILLLILLVPSNSMAVQNSLMASEKTGPVTTFQKHCGFVDTNNDGEEDDDPDADGTTTLNDIFKSGKVTRNIVNCAERIINRGGNRLMNTYIRMFSNIAVYSIVFAIVLHGIRMMYGMANNHGVSIMIIIKISVIFFLCSPDGFMFLKNSRNALLGFGKGIGGSIVAGSSGSVEFNDPVGLLAQITGIQSMLCKPNGTTAAGTKCTHPMVEVFDKVDELTLKLLGIDPNDTERSQSTELNVGVAALVGGLFFTGPIGAAITMVVLLYVTALIFAMAQIALFFIVVAVAMNILMVLAPVAAVCMLFTYTQRIARIWFNYVLIYTIQPIVLIAFMLFLVQILTPISDSLKPLYDEVNLKWRNSSASQVQLFNCLDMDASASNVNSQLSQNDMWTNLMDTAFKQQLSNDRTISGNANYQDSVNYNKQKCGISTFAIKLDPEPSKDSTGADIIGKLTRQDIEGMMAKYIASIFCLVIIISMIKEVPEMVGKMVTSKDSGGAPDLSKISSSLETKATGALEWAGRGGRNLIGQMKF